MAKLKLNKALIKKVEKYASEGMYNVVICQLIGITEQTFYDWLNKAEAEKEKGIVSLYTEFSESLKKADAERERKWLKEIDKDPSWQSKAWCLERKYRDRWGRNDTLTLKHGVDKDSAKEVISILQSLTDADLKHALEQADIKDDKKKTNGNGKK